MSVITFFNQKGGVGKTTCSVLLIDYLIQQGKKILAIDLDPQGSLSEVYSDGYATTLLDYFMRSQPLDNCLTSINDNLDLLASHVRLMDLPQIDSAYLEDEKINFLAIFSSYDYIIIDSQPSFSWFSRLSIKLANYILMPTQMSRFCYEALQGALKEISRMKTEDYREFYVFENLYKNKRIILKESFRDLFKEKLGENFLDEKLPEVVSIEERTAGEHNYFSLTNKPNKNSLSFFSHLMEKIR